MDKLKVGDFVVTYDDGKLLKCTVIRVTRIDGITSGGICRKDGRLVVIQSCITDKTDYTLITKDGKYLERKSKDVFASKEDFLNRVLGKECISKKQEPISSVGEKESIIELNTVIPISKELHLHLLKMKGLIESINFTTNELVKEAFNDSSN